MEHYLEKVGILGWALQKLQYGAAIALTAFVAYPFWLALIVQEKLTHKPFWRAGWLAGELRYESQHPIIIPRKAQARQEVPEIPFPIQDLPEELQISILEYALGPWDAHGLHEDYQQFRYENSERVGMGYVIFGCPPMAMSLLLTNHHMHNLTMHALSNTFTGHLSILNPRRGTKDLAEWFRVTSTHPTFLNHKFIMERVAVMRTDQPLLATFWRCLSSPSANAPLFRKAEFNVLPQLRRIECDLTQSKLPLSVSWSQNDLRRFRIEEHNAILVTEATRIAGEALQQELLSELRDIGFEFCITFNVAISDRVTRHKIAVAQVQVSPCPAKVLRRVIKTADGHIEWEEEDKEIALLPRPLPGEVDSNWHLYDLWP